MHCGEQWVIVNPRKAYREYFCPHCSERQRPDVAMMLDDDRYVEQTIQEEQKAEKPKPKRKPPQTFDKKPPKAAVKPAVVEEPTLEAFEEPEVDTTPEPVPEPYVVPQKPYEEDVEPEKPKKKKAPTLTTKKDPKRRLSEDRMTEKMCKDGGWWNPVTKECMGEGNGFLPLDNQPES
jgi:hypothetical protein